MPVFILTDAQAVLVADALEIISPNDERMEEEAQALAVQFRAATQHASRACNSKTFTAGGRVEELCGRPAAAQSVCTECDKARCDEHAAEECFEETDGKTRCEDCQMLFELRRND